MPEALRPVVWLDVVGLTPRLLAHAPTLSALAAARVDAADRGRRPARDAARPRRRRSRASRPSGHGVVGNGWFHRDTGEVRFWLQSQGLVVGRDRRDRGAAARDGARAAVHGGARLRVVRPGRARRRHGDAEAVVRQRRRRRRSASTAARRTSRRRSSATLGPFPFASFWGPRAGLPVDDVDRARGRARARDAPADFTLVYLPHLDYDLQRLGPDAPGTAGARRGGRRARRRS